MIQLKNVNFSYSQFASLFDKLSLEIGSGKIYGLLGKNGTGKTTLIRVMSGLLMPREGECMLFEKDATKRYPSVLSQLFIVPEEFELPPVKGTEYVSMNAPFYPNFNIQQFEAYIGEFEVDIKRKLSTLSYGQKKKFLIAFSLATNVKLLLLDEPTNGLDIPSKSQFRKSVARSIDDSKTIIISTHQARDLEMLIDTILVVEDGRIVLNKSCADVTRYLHFGKAAKIEDESSVLYKEEALGGYKLVQKARKESESELDLELLFNAVVANSHRFNEFLNANTKEKEAIQ